MNRALLRRAAAFIDAEATLHRESCQIERAGQKPVDWACADCVDKAACRAKRRYDQLRKVASDLRKEARAT